MGTFALFDNKGVCLKLGKKILVAGDGQQSYEIGVDINWPITVKRGGVELEINVSEQQPTDEVIKLASKEDVILDAGIVRLKTPTENKKIAVITIKMALLGKFKDISSIISLQEYGHGRGISTKAKIIPDEEPNDLARLWSEYFEKLTFLEDEIADWDAIKIEDIRSDNYSIFPIVPAMPNNYIRMG